MLNWNHFKCVFAWLLWRLQLLKFVRQVSWFICKRQRMEVLIVLQMWYSHLYRRRAGSNPRSSDVRLRNLWDNSGVLQIFSNSCYTKSYRRSWQRKSRPRTLAPNMQANDLLLSLGRMLVCLCCTTQTEILVTPSMLAQNLRCYGVQWSP